MARALRPARSLRALLLLGGAFFVGLTLVAAVLVAAGLAGFRRRDIA